jgi:chromosome segregation ATPase
LKTRVADVSKENTKLASSLEISLKQNEADLIMAKKSADASKHNLEKLHLEKDNEKNIIKNLNTQIEQFKLQERLEVKNQANLKSRIHELERLVAQNETGKETHERTVLDKFRSKERELNDQLTRLSIEHNNTQSLHKNLEQKLQEVGFCYIHLTFFNDLTIF